MLHFNNKTYCLHQLRWEKKRDCKERAVGTDSDTRHNKNIKCKVSLNHRVPWRPSVCYIRLNLGPKVCQSWSWTWKVTKPHLQSRKRQSNTWKINIHQRSSRAAVQTSLCVSLWRKRSQHNSRISDKHWWVHSQFQHVHFVRTRKQVEIKPQWLNSG